MLNRFGARTLTHLGYLALILLNVNAAVWKEGPKEETLVPKMHKYQS